MILMLFGAIALTGIIGTGYMATMKGPGRSLSAVKQDQTTVNIVLGATGLLQPTISEQDCDADGMIEPVPFRSGAGPSGGGLIPLESGAGKTDAWGRPLGYCVWDHGKKTRSDNISACGGSSVNRLQGGNTTTEYVLAVISPGKDGIFQTTCNAWADANNDKAADIPLVQEGGDDIVHTDTIESLLSSGTLTQLPALPDSACVAGAEGTMRYENGVPQVCTSTGWKEVGAASNVNPTFLPTGPVNPLTTHTSNAITTSGYFGSRKVTVDNGAELIINSLPTGSNTADVPVGATVAIQGTSAAFPANPASLAQTPKIFTLKIGSVSKTWTLTTRGRTAPAFSITPSPSNNMNVTGPAGVSGTHYGTSVQFTVRNTGEAQANAIAAVPALSNTTNFEITGTNQCLGFVLQGSNANNCTFYVRPKAATPGAYTGTVTVSAAGATSGVATLNGTATGWACNLPWGGTLAHGGSVTSYSQLAPAYSAVCSSYATTRTCSNAILSAGGANQYCYQWNVGGFGGCSATCGGGSQTRTVQCLRIAGSTVVADGNCHASKPATSQSCNTQSCCGGSLLWGVCFYAVRWDQNQTCRQFCSTRGGMNLTGFTNNIGKNGTLAKCRQAISTTFSSNLGWVSDCPGVNGGGANCNCVSELCQFHPYSPVTGYRCTVGTFNPDTRTDQICACNT